jgi:hypothetical protein
MLLCRLEVSLELRIRTEAEQAGETCELMAYSIVVLKVVLETPLIIECAQAQVAIHVMAERVLQMILETVAVFEDALA